MNQKKTFDQEEYKREIEERKKIDDKIKGDVLIRRSHDVLEIEEDRKRRIEILQHQSPSNTYGKKRRIIDSNGVMKLVDDDEVPTYDEPIGDHRGIRELRMTDRKEEPRRQDIIRDDEENDDPDRALRIHLTRLYVKQTMQWFIEGKSEMEVRELFATNGQFDEEDSEKLIEMAKYNLPQNSR